MCVSVYSSLLLFTLTTISILSTRMVTEGLSLARQERGADDGLLAGADFLSVFMGSSLRQAQREASTSTITTTTEESSTFSNEPEPVSRESRSTTYDSLQAQDTTISAQLENTDQSSDGVVVGVRVSSSIGRTLINKEGNGPDLETTTIFNDQNFVASEEHPSIVAEVNKSEFSVEESDPITSNSFAQGYPASVQPIPNSAFLSHQNSDKEKLQPIHQTVIYHNNPREPGRARSVSYSTVIQSAPQPHLEKTWEDHKHERHERNFDNTRTPYENILDKDKVNETKSDSTWQKTDFTTEKNWGLPEKSYAHGSLPIIYGKPEQNYEVDESASVMTNGRIHGIQPSPTIPTRQEVKIGESRKTDDNQKVGYVVEGRNYRKYRVEERTSDGFIVGEYGVVSHDDGSLRGVRYTADGTISPRLIYDTLMKFLSL